MIRPRNSQRIGVLGTGRLAQELIRGWRQPPRVRHLGVSSHNKLQSADLADRFGVAVFSSNRELVENSDIVLICLRREDVELALSSLPLADKLIVSAVAGLDIASLRAITGATAVVRCLPLSAAGLHRSFSITFPHDAVVIDLLDLLGVTTVLDSESDFDVATSLGAYYGWLFALTEEVQAFLMGKGMSPDVALRLVGGVTQAAGGIVREAASIGDLMSAVETPGGITAAGLEVLRDAQAFSPWSNALEKVSAAMRLRG